MGLFGKTVVHQLTLSPDYVRHWGAVEAVRELIQNALDSDSPFEYSFKYHNELKIDDDTLEQRLVPLGTACLTLTSRNARLHARTLVLGHTTKADREDAIGSFGEGYKIALLVLTRLGRDVVIKNNDRHWHPFFKRVDSFECDLLHIRDSALSTPVEGLEFHIELTQEEVEAVVDSCLQMQPEMADAIPVQQGRILPSRPGKLYVGGLYICDTQLTHGYDLKPGVVKLERDRQTVADFELKWLTKEMWFEAKQPARVAEMMEAGAPDLSLAEYDAPELVREACYALFNQRNPGGIAAKDQKELESLVERGLTQVTVVSSPSFYSAVTKSSSYQRSAGEKVRVPTPLEALSDWFKENRKHFHRTATVNYKALLEQAKNWRNK